MFQSCDLHNCFSSGMDFPHSCSLLSSLDAAFQIYFTEFPTIIDFFFFSLRRQEYQRGMVWEEFSSYLLESRPCYGISSRDISQWLLILYLCWSHTGIFFRFFTVRSSWSSRVRATKLWGIPLIKNSMTQWRQQKSKVGLLILRKGLIEGGIRPFRCSKKEGCDSLTLIMSLLLLKV